MLERDANPVLDTIHILRAPAGMGKPARIFANEHGLFMRLDAIQTVEFTNPEEKGTCNLCGAGYTDRQITEAPYAWPSSNVERNPNSVRLAVALLLNTVETATGGPSTAGGSGMVAASGTGDPSVASGGGGGGASSAASGGGGSAVSGGV